MADDDNRHPGVSITVSLSGDLTLDINEVWPDGDAPETITAAAVRDVMRDSGTMLDVLGDWELDDQLSVTVTVYTDVDEGQGGTTIDTAGVWD